MSREDKRTMTNHCQRMMFTADDWILAKETDEPTRVYWRLIKQASELWLEQNAKKKRPLRKRPRLRRPEAGQIEAVASCLGGLPGPGLLLANAVATPSFTICCTIDLKNSTGIEPFIREKLLGI